MKLWVINRNTGELRHHGTKGMKWGQRLYQNKDGSLTNLGKLRYGTKTEFRAAMKKKAAAKAAKNEVKRWNKIRKKKLNELTDEELELSKKRLKKEQEVKDLKNSVSKKAVTAGQEFVKKFAKEAIGDSVVNVGKTLVTNFLKKRLGIDAEDVTNMLDVLDEKGLRNMTDAEISKLGKRAESVKEAKKQFGIKDGDDDKGSDSDSNNAKSNSKPKNNTNSGSDKKADNQTESDKKTEKQAKKDSKTSTTTDDDSKVYTGKVSGKGSSRGSQNRKNTKSRSERPDDYYDPIETEFVDRSSPASSVSPDLIRLGRRRISGYLT
jgi:hypothetical protein